MIKKFTYAVFFLFAILSTQSLSDDSLFHTTLTLTNNFELDIQEEDDAIVLTLSQGSNIQSKLSIENADTSMRLIQKEKLCKSSPPSYFITAYDRSSTYGAETYIIIWQSEKTWKMFQAPFDVGHLEKDAKGNFNIIEYYPPDNQIFYRFKKGKLIEVTP